MRGVVNPLVARILRSRGHRVLSGHLALLEVRGRRSGRAYEFPVAYHADSADLLRVDVDHPESKTWWRNFCSPWPMRIWIDGRPCAAAGVAVERGDRVSVLVHLDLVSVAA